LIEAGAAQTGLARRVLTRPLLWWAIAAAFLVRDVVGNLMTTYRPDAASVILAGQRWLHDPAAVYAETARHLAQTGLVPVSGGLIRPPATAMLGSVFTVLPASWQVGAWTVADAIAALAGLVLVQRYVARTSLERAVFWAIALYWPPFYAEVNAGQVGGFVLLFACAGLVTYRTRPGWSGALAAAAASLKLYPALMVIGARISWRPFLLGAALAGAVITIAACIPLGPAGAWQYVTGVLIPSLRAPNPDCAQTSVSTLFGRSVGGDPYPIINPDGSISTLQSPLHLSAIAAVLTVATLATIVIAAIAAARASGWNPGYGMALGLALGALLPGELNPYQYLPLLPLVLLVLVMGIRGRRGGYIAVLAAGLLLFLRQPCLLPFPNVWTIGALLLFGVCVAAARDFRQDRA
jgi:Glycosyltransferase family 87